jgi:hypothetical protein
VLAGAVSAGGGLGMIGVGSTTPESWIAEQANLARPHGPFGIGLLIWALETLPSCCTRRSMRDLRPFPSTLATRRPT